MPWSWWSLSSIQPKRVLIVLISNLMLNILSCIFWIPPKFVLTSSNHEGFRVEYDRLQHVMLLRQWNVFVFLFMFVVKPSKLPHTIDLKDTHFLHGFFPKKLFHPNMINDSPINTYRRGIHCHDISNEAN